MYSPFYRRTFLIATLVILGWVLVTILLPLWATLGWAAVLAFLLHPLHERLTAKLKDRPSVSAGILTSLTPFLLVAPLSLIGIAFARQVANILTNMKGQSLMSYPALLARLDTVPLVGGAVRWMRESAPVSADQVQEWLTDAAQTVLKLAASMSGSFALGVMGSLIGFFMMLFLLFFLLRDGRAMLERLTGFIPLEHRPRAQLMSYLGDVTRAVIFGSAATALIQGIFVGAGFVIVGLPSAVVFGVLATIAAFLPAGAIIVLIPAIVYLMVTGRWGAAIFLIVWAGVMAIVENVLRPILTAHRTHVSTLAVFVGAIGGAAAFGILGLVIGPVILGFITALLNFAEKGAVESH
jgi:predicted PurR-regulated permease PerM